MIRSKSNRGLTLIELMTTLGIISIIAGISWTYFEKSKMRGMRSDAIIALTKARAYMEKCYSNYRKYNQAGVCNDLPTALKTSPKGLYTIEFKTGSPTATGYVLHAKVDTSKAQADDECQVIG